MSMFPCLPLYISQEIQQEFHWSLNSRNVTERCIEEKESKGFLKLSFGWVIHFTAVDPLKRKLLNETDWCTVWFE